MGGGFERESDFFRESALLNSSCCMNGLKYILHHCGAVNNNKKNKVNHCGAGYILQFV